MKNPVFLFVLLLFSFQTYAGEKKTICLNMIVKNESDVIEQCLGSLKHLIDHWVIVDTGSTDGTQEIVRNFLKDVPGELYERPWVDFAHNRNEALEYAKGKGDYLLLIDADEMLQIDDSFTLPDLKKDYYMLILRCIGEGDGKKMAFINNSINWRWEGVIHESLYGPIQPSFDLLTGIRTLYNVGVGARSKDPLKTLKDAKVLEKALEKEPSNSRYAFYLGQAYYAAKEYGLAIKSYEKRVCMPGQAEETFLALMNLAKCQKQINKPVDTIAKSLFCAYQLRPTRAEPLYEAALLYRENGNPFLGYLIAKFALTIPRPEGELVLVSPIYDFALMLEFVNCALFSNCIQEAIVACENLLKNPHLPIDLKEQVAATLIRTKKSQDKE